MLRSGSDEAGKLVLDRLCVRVQARVVVELGLEESVPAEQWIEEDVVSHAEHDTVANGDLITRDEARVILGELFLTLSKEGLPLGVEDLFEASLLGGGAGH